MKHLLFILTMIISLNSFAQDKIVKIPQSELDAFFLAVDTLEQQDSIKTLLIADLELQLDNFRTLNAKNESILLNKDQEIILLNDQIKLYEDRLKITDKWYNKRWFGVVVGVVSTSTAIYLAGQLGN
tara:strand:- start:2792 stop:3172 length:381 start_codon:yes stop_codon:yes gene_type:complete